MEQDQPSSTPVHAGRSLSIPGSGARKVAAYSVSLRDKSFEFSPITVDPEASFLPENATDNEQGIACNTRCAACGQCLPQAAKSPKIVQSRQRGYGTLEDEDRHMTNFASRSLPANLEGTRDGVNFRGDTSGQDSGEGFEHCHGVRVVEPNHKARRQLIIASVLCLLFMVGEIVGGYLANSLAIATDAAHLLTDFASFMISLFSLWVASRPATKRMSFGWYRAEVLGALISVLLIWVVTGILVYLAIQRIISKEFDIDANVMLITSGIGVAVNIIMGLTLHQHGHSHGGSSHSHAHDPERQALVSHSHSHGDHGHSHSSSSVETDTNINVRAAFIHVIGDFIQSLGVLVAALVIFYKPEWSIVDPICTFLFSVLVLLTTVAILRDALTVLMEGIPRGLDFNAVQKAFLSIDGVIRVHNLRIWALSMDKTALAAHLAVGPGVSAQQVLLKASRLVRSKFNVFEMTLQIEEFETGMEDCTQCQEPED